MSGEPGDLVAIPFPYSDLQTRKRRPVLILTPPDRHGDLVCLAVTSVPSEEQVVPITSEDLTGGALPKASWIRCDKIFTLSEALIAKRYGRLSAEKWTEVLAQLCSYLGCQNRGTDG